MKSKNINRKWYRKWWGILIIMCILFFSIILISFLLTVYNNYSKLISANGYNSPIANVNSYDFSARNTEVYNIVVSDDDPYTGPIDADLTIVEFFDFRCEFCKQVHPIVRRLSLEYKDRVRFIFRDFPLLGGDSMTLALAGECANAQGKFLSFHDKVYGEVDSVSLSSLNALAKTIGLDLDAFQQCMVNQEHSDEISKDYSDAIRAGVTGTPVFFINGNRVGGAIPYESFKKMIDTTLEQINIKNK